VYRAVAHATTFLAWPRAPETLKYGSMHFFELKAVFIDTGEMLV